MRFCAKIPKNYITEPIIKQLIRAGTSIGANYAEANGASSKKDFKNKIHICKKEAQETRYWLRILIVPNEELTAERDILLKEARELTLRFAKIAVNTK